MVLFWKILTLILPLILCAENDSNEYGPFVDTPLVHKLKGLDYELQTDREEEIGIKEEVQRQAMKQAEIRHSIANTGPKKAHIPNIEELLADLPLPLLKAVQKKRKENMQERQDAEAEASNVASAKPETHSSDSLPQSAPSSASTNLLETTTKTSSFPSQIPPPPLDFSQSESMPLDPSIPSSSYPSPPLSSSSLAFPADEGLASSSILPPPSASFSDGLLSLDDIPLPPQLPQEGQFIDPALYPQQQFQQQQPQQFRPPFFPPFQQQQQQQQQQQALQQQAFQQQPLFQQPPVPQVELLQQQQQPATRQHVQQQPRHPTQQHPQPQQHPQQHPSAQTLQQAPGTTSNRFQQQQQQGTARVPRIPLRYRRQSQRQPLQPIGGFSSPPLGYSSFIQAPAVSVINGIPLQLSSNPPVASGLLEAESSTYYPSQATDSTVNSHDVAYSHRQRMNSHPEPILPDLPLPPVVAPV